VALVCEPDKNSRAQVFPASPHQANCKLLTFCGLYPNIPGEMAPTSKNTAITNESEAAQTLEILRTQSLTTIVLQELERMIIEGELKAGERINEKALAARQKVSRGPIREACRRLEQAGLVEIIVNRGVFVRKLKLKEALDLYDIRWALSDLAGRLLAARITAKQLKQLSDMVDRMDILVQAADLETYYPLNLEFHERLMEFAGNERMATVYDEVSKELHLFRRRSLVVGAGLKKSNAEHRRIVEALKAGDVETVVAVLKGHALAGKTRMMEVLPESERKSVQDVLKK
jgi:DNA-binding GntR family transcriptional regulator